MIVQSAFGAPTFAIAYRYTGQEFDAETGLHNFRARLYDSDLFRFYSTDPADEQHSPYSFVGNSPLMYVDKDGQWFVLAVLAIGAVANVASNWDAITANGGIDVGRLAGFAAVGVGSSALGFVSGPLAPLAWAGGGFGSGFLNTVIGGGSAEQALSAGVSSIAPSVFGGVAGQVVGGLASNITINGTNLGSLSPLLQGAVGGGLSGFAGGFASSLVSGSNIGEAFGAGLKGGAIGLAVGAATRSAQAFDDGIDPISGKPLSPSLPQQPSIDATSVERTKATKKADGNVADAVRKAGFATDSEAREFFGWGRLGQIDKVIDDFIIDNQGKFVYSRDTGPMRVDIKGLKAIEGAYLRIQNANPGNQAAPVRAQQMRSIINQLFKGH